MTQISAFSLLKSYEASWILLKTRSASLYQWALSNFIRSWALLWRDSLGVTAFVTDFDVREIVKAFTYLYGNALNLHCWGYSYKILVFDFVNQLKPQFGTKLLYLRFVMTERDFHFDFDLLRLNSWGIVSLFEECFMICFFTEKLGSGQATKSFVSAFIFEKETSFLEIFLHIFSLFAFIFFTNIWSFFTCFLISLRSMLCYGRSSSESIKNSSNCNHNDFT